MATYIAAEAAVLTRCRSYGDGEVFGEANSSRDDWSVIDGDDASLVVTMGGPSLEGDTIDRYGAHGEYMERHEIKVTVLRKVGTGESGSAAIVQALKETTEALKDWLREDRLASVARDMTLPRTSQVLERQAARGGAPTHVAQEITLYVYCESEL